MGLADVVPGVSGGTIALILGIYPKLVDAVSGLGVSTLRRLADRSLWMHLRSGLTDPEGIKTNGPDAKEPGSSQSRTKDQESEVAEQAQGDRQQPNSPQSAKNQGEVISPPLPVANGPPQRSQTTQVHSANSPHSEPEAADARRLLLLAFVAAGALPALVLGASFVQPLLDLYPSQMRGFFMGLILASVVIPFREIRRRSASRWALAAIAALAAVWFTGLPERTVGHARGTVQIHLQQPAIAETVLTPRNLTLIAPEATGTHEIVFGIAESVVVPQGTITLQAEVVARMAGSAANVPAEAIQAAEASPLPISAITQPDPLTGGSDPSLTYIFLAGVLAISAMTLPGLSGAFVLLVLGLYHYLTFALKTVILHGDTGSIPIVATMVAAMLTSLLTFARVLRWLLYRWRDGTLAVLAGLMVGSVRKLWPFVEHLPEGRELLALPSPGDPTGSVVLLFTLGATSVLALEAAGRRMGPG